MKILINQCYGGFGFSDEFLKEFEKRHPDKKLRNKNHDDIRVRTDPDIIALVEELGPEECSGIHADICVCEFPDGMEFEIREYDGIESLQWEMPKDKIIQDLIDLIKGRKKEDETCKFTQELLKKN